MLRYWLLVACTLGIALSSAEAAARGRGYGSGSGGFGILLALGGIAALGYALYWVGRRFPGLGPFLGGLVVIFSVSTFVATVLKDIGIIEDEVLTALVLPFLAWGAIALYSKLK